MLTIRLRRMGKRDRAFYRFVVSDSRRTPTASAVEELGHYDPLQKEIRLKRDRIDYWVSHGATLSNSVKTLIRRADHGALAPADAPAEAAVEAKPASPETTEAAASAPASAPAASAPAASEAAAKEATETKPEAEPTEAAETKTGTEAGGETAEDTESA
jgi:small subunit ribosomal protein S16